MKSAEEKLIQALEAYVAFRESAETWAAEFKKGSAEMRQNFMINLPLSMGKVNEVREYAAEKGRQSDVSKENLETITRAAIERSQRLNESHTARTKALMKLSEALNERR